MRDKEHPQYDAADVPKAVALITAAYGVGAGIPALVRAVDARVILAVGEV